MAPSTPMKQSGSGIERVRAQLLTSLHVGKLRPGDRVPSVRRLADQTGMNRKTVHRAYQVLADEGLLDLRPGSGTYISDGNGGAAGHHSTAELLRAANRCRAEAASLGLTPDVFAAFLGAYLSDSLRGLPLAIVECNREQIGLIADELHAGLGVHPRPVLIRELQADPARVLAGTWGTVTTDCHRAEVARLAGSVPAMLYSIALDRAFPQRVVEHARAGAVVMVVRDRSFAPVFLRLLRNLSVPEEMVARVRIVEPEDARPALLEAGEDVAVYVSPLVDRTGMPRLPAGARRLSMRWRLAPGALERLRAQISLDLTVRGLGRVAG